jgi:hypothetical protein
MCISNADPDSEGGKVGENETNIQINIYNSKYGTGTVPKYRKSVFKCASICLFKLKVNIVFVFAKKKFTGTVSIDPKPIVKVGSESV